MPEPTDPPDTTRGFWRWVKMPRLRMRAERQRADNEAELAAFDPDRIRPAVIDRLVENLLVDELCWPATAKFERLGRWAGRLGCQRGPDGRPGQPGLRRWGVRPRRRTAGRRGVHGQSPRVGRCVGPARPNPSVAGVARRTSVLGRQPAAVQSVASRRRTRRPAAAGPGGRAAERSPTACGRLLHRPQYRPPAEPVGPAAVARRAHSGRSGGGLGFPRRRRGAGDRPGRRPGPRPAWWRRRAGDGRARPAGGRRAAFTCAAGVLRHLGAERRGV